MCGPSTSYWSGDIGKAFADALAERSRAGVKVRHAGSLARSAVVGESTEHLAASIASQL
ncbi:hypothetical protein [Variovorax sp. WS11]|uniref:hypothetical protein n=1 Tax=Variovorax sp. WS11 TaxID=1105204 RepID=UPI0013DCAA81|nr:hypothetical protein [Variovorax sp. WS11]NDZ18685.1 hypothetical protein [Variovorax sp. WS11]